MDLLFKLIYISIAFGYPVLLLIPVSVVVAPVSFFSAGEEGFLKTFQRQIIIPSIVVSSLCLVFNILIFVTEKRSGSKTFKLQQYNDLEAFRGNTDDLKNGQFKIQSGKYIMRHDSLQYEFDLKDTDTTKFKIKWISDSEYSIERLDKNYNGMQTNISTVKIISNTPDYYECYVKFGDYTDSRPIKILKIK